MIDCNGKATLLQLFLPRNLEAGKGFFLQDDKEKRVMAVMAAPKFAVISIFFYRKDKQIFPMLNHLKEICQNHENLTTISEQDLTWFIYFSLL